MHTVHWILLLLTLVGTAASAQTLAPAALLARASEHVQPALATMQELVGIESGSRDVEGLTRVAQVVSARLQAAGMQVQVLPSQAPDFHPTLKGVALGPMVFASRQGTGKNKVLLIVHMDTVYLRGMGAKQPFRIDGDRAYGLGIADAKGGVALVLHTVQLLQQLGFNDYAELAVLFNADEEIGSPGSAQRLTQLGSNYDAVFSFEGGGGEKDILRLATSSLASVQMKVTGRASHAGSNPEAGRNALVEMAHQILKTRNFGEAERGLKINWTVASAGAVSNVIPSSATATADVRALARDDLDRLEARLREAVKDKLIPDTTVELNFVRGRPAFQGNAVSVAMARHGQKLFREMGLELEVRDRASGGGTDAAFAGLRPKGGVLEGMGLRGYGSHSEDNEYVHISSIAPRLALAVRMVMDVGSGALAW
jgi:glutamate carboxypeptidase